MFNLEAETFLFTMAGTAFTFAMTALGASCVLMFKRTPGELWTKLSLGFAAGIMIAASVWSLLIPAMDAAAELGRNPTMASAGGFILGAASLMLLDTCMPHLHVGSSDPEGPKSHLDKNQLIFLAVTIHNIPEGMAVGIAFTAAAASGSPEVMSTAMALALGIGIQNIPEGAAITLPLHAGGAGRAKAFLLGTLSGLVEPIAAAVVVFLSSFFIPLMPWLLSFAAGAMVYVVVEELIPEARLGEHSNLGTAAVLAGFVLMMVLDTSLG